MRTPHRALLLATVASSAALAGLAPSVAHAQLDTNPPPPNVLLLIDTSGSMEYLIDSQVVGGQVRNKLPGAVVGSSCDVGAPAPTVLNRWATLVSVLTGTINNFSCRKTDRQNADFINDFSFKGAPPYDTTAKYYLPFHRLMSNNCTPIAGDAPNKWWEWPNNAIKYRDIDTKAPCDSWTKSASQAPDGILDTFRDRIRFAMMTFDSYSDPGTGMGVGDAPDAVTGMKGQWSYYPDWVNGTNLYAKGNPAGCVPVNAPYEVGARNQAAPPWEGRLIPFGPQDATLSDIQTTNDHIQEALIAMRPFGATPIDGMFADAREFLTGDGSTDHNTGKDFGPKNDQFYTGGCRKQFVILLSDGTPNEDLRPYCALPSGNCPYTKTAADNALDLASLPGNAAIQTYVVGFALPPPASLPAGKTCADLDLVNDCDPAKNPPPELLACCSLNKIANAGGTQHAYFANDLINLKKQIGQILAAISAGATARTVPVFSTTGFAGGGDPASDPQGDAPAASYRFVGQFKADASGELWTGDLKRERFVCQNGVATPQPIAADKGDDFSANINSGAGPTRKFFTYVAPVDNNKIHSQQSIRPCVVTDDGLGTYGSLGAPCTLVPAGNPPMGFMTPIEGANFAAQLKVVPRALGMEAGAGPSACKDTLNVNNVGDCIDKLIKWNVGEPTPPVTRDRATCINGANCSELGSIYHATPSISTPPRELLRDDTYAKFVQDRAARPIVLYTATTDGQLHAFKVSATAAADPQRVDKKENNELWTFIPPYVLPSLLGAYNQQSILLDGPPVVSDVVFERRQGDAATWSTVLVAGSGTQNGFYYALDVTDPTKPRFLWQLSTDDKDKALFGSNPRSPAIATIALPDVGGASLKEVAVAILPGGYSAAKDGGGEDGDGEEDGDDDGPKKGKSCSRPIALSGPPAGYSLMNDGTYAPRTKVRCWNSDAGRSLTIVRLDTGEVIMNFRDKKKEGPDGLLSSNPIHARTSKKPAPNNVPFTSPITGIPVAYPGQTGQVANRVYVGDADGQMWRIDVSGTDPLLWRVDLAWDAYSITPGDQATDGQLVQTAPVVSINALGDTVVLYSTGDQEILSTADVTTRAWSILEKRNSVSKVFETYGNWYKSFGGGERVTGPMAIFDSVTYFSSFSPAGVGAICSFGTSKVWALDYLSAAGRFPNDPANPAAGFKEFETAANTVIFGVALTKTPSCNTSADSSDSFFGNHKSISNVNGGNYQIVWQKGPGAGVSANAGVKTDASTGVQSMNLTTPRQSTRIDSWASLFE